jgi:aminomethyltransferase
MTMSTDLLKTPLHAAHVARGARMAPFAGYDMPIQYPLGVLGEHLFTREKAGLFDVSHMGQALLVSPDGRHESVARFLETLVPADILGLAPGRQRYTQLLAADGGILDDLMVTRPAAGEAGALGLVVNAARKEADYAHVEAHLPAGFRLVRREDRALVALQGPASARVLARHCPQAEGLGFMEAATATFDGKPCAISRSGYTGEDGYEISIAAAYAPTLWDSLLAHEDDVRPIGLGARDSLRLEAGLCLYGHDIDETTSPIEAGLAWSIQKRRREEGGFPGAERILREIAEGPARRRVGIRPEGRQPAREGAPIEAEGRAVGAVTSGGFGPSLNAPVAMGYVEARHAAPGAALTLVVRGKALPAAVVGLPFVPSRFFRKPAPTGA